MAEAKKKTLQELFDICGEHIEGAHRIQLFRKEGSKRIPTQVVWRISSPSMKSLTHFDIKQDGTKTHKFEGTTILKAMSRFFDYLKKRGMV